MANFRTGTVAGGTKGWTTSELMEMDDFSMKIMRKLMSESNIVYGFLFLLVGWEFGG